jgi:hypothetical protein
MTTPAHRVIEAFQRISLPQAIVFATFCASVTCVFVFAGETIQKLDWRAVAAATSTVLTAALSFFSKPVVKARDQFGRTIPPKPFEPLPTLDAYGQSLRPIGPNRHVHFEHDEDPTPGEKPSNRAPPMKQPREDGSIELNLMVALVVGFVTLAVALVVVGCGPHQQHSALDRLADVADPSYALAVEACDEAEGRIIDRPPTSYENDAAAIARIRETCDRVFGAFEALRLAHRAARAAVDGGASGALDAALSSLGEAWRAAQQLLPEIAGMRTAGGES